MDSMQSQAVLLRSKWNATGCSPGVCDAYRLVSESNTKTKQDTAQVEHGKVLGCAVDDSTNSEPESGDDHAPLSTNASVQQVGYQTGNGTCECKRL